MVDCLKERSKFDLLWAPATIMSDAELDYDDPSFLIDTPSTTATSNSSSSYAERRQQKLNLTQQNRLLNAQPKTGRAAEVQRREEGLAKNLITFRKDEEGEGESKALKMMRSEYSISWFRLTLTKSRSMIG